jgi:hypothetical protein
MFISILSLKARMLPKAYISTALKMTGVCSSLSPSVLWIECRQSDLESSIARFFIAGTVRILYSHRMSDVLLPYAKTSEGNLVEPTTATRDEDYLCLECERSVRLRAGRVRRRHFYHKVETSCEGESVIHKAAKLKLREVFEASLNGGDLPVLLVPCVRHRSWHTYDPCEKTLEQRFSYPFTDVGEEVTVGSFRLDVALLEDGKVTFGVELYHRHRVPEAKTKGLGVSWIELDAEQVLSDASALKVIESNLKKSTCRACSRRTGLPFQPQKMLTLPGELERFPFVQSCEGLSPELKRCLPPAKIYLDTTHNRLYVLFEVSFRHHYSQLLQHLVELKTSILHVFGSDVPLAIGLLNGHGYTFGASEFDVPTSLTAGSRSPTVSPFLTIVGAKHLRVEALKVHVSERLFERLKPCSIFDHHEEKTLWVIAPNEETLYWLDVHRNELRGIVWYMYEHRGRLRLIRTDELPTPSSDARLERHLKG